MSFKVPNQHRIRNGPYGSNESAGLNGAFELTVQCFDLLIIASDGGDWEHVSVSIPGRTKPPPWSVMCTVKDMFWDKNDWVIQYHPAESDYVNCAENCLHLWRPMKAAIPTPPTWMVGPKPAAEEKKDD